MSANNQNIAEFLERHRVLSAPGLGEENGGWPAVVGKISPVLGGVMGEANFINGIIASRKNAEFQKKLIGALKKIESELEGIKDELDAIYQELKNIEIDIEGLGLNDKMSAIEGWGQDLAALEPGDTAGAQHLATDMMDASNGATNLLGCMDAIHDAMVGNTIGTPLIELVDAASFIRLRMRLVQGLHLLAFATAFNTQEEYDFGVFLLQWSANFEQQLKLYFAAGKEAWAKADLQAPMPAADSIVVYRYAQPAVANAALVIEGTGEPMTLYTGTLGWTETPAYSGPMLGFAGVNAACYVDLRKNASTTDVNSALGQACDPLEDPKRWLMVPLGILSGLDQVLVYERGNLVSAARVDPRQTLLGAVNGQQAWVEAAGATTYFGSIHDGSDTGAPLVLFDAAAESVRAVAFDDLESLTPVLWVVSWVAKDVVTIAWNGSTDAAPVYLTVGADGAWAMASEPVRLTVTAAEAKQGAMGVPSTMAPTTATIGAGGAVRTVLFHQL